MTDTRRGGRERRGAGAQGSAGTRLKVEGDVVMAHADENPKRRAQGQRQGRREMVRRRRLMEGPPAGEDDRGVPPKGCLRRPPRSAYRSEDRAEAQGRVRAREIQPWRGDDQRRAHGAGEQH